MLFLPCNIRPSNWEIWGGSWLLRNCHDMTSQVWTWQPRHDSMSAWSFVMTAFGTPYYGVRKSKQPDKMRHAGINTSQPKMKLQLTSTVNHQWHEWDRLWEHSVPMTTCLKFHETQLGENLLGKSSHLWNHVRKWNDGYHLIVKFEGEYFHSNRSTTLTKVTLLLRRD
jgi:hypothetical protein